MRAGEISTMLARSDVWVALSVSALAALRGKAIRLPVLATDPSRQRSTTQTPQRHGKEAATQQRHGKDTTAVHGRDAVRARRRSITALQRHECMASGTSR